MQHLQMLGFSWALCVYTLTSTDIPCVCLTGRYIPSTLLQGTLIYLIQAMTILIYYKCGSPFSFFFSKYPVVPFWLAWIHFLRNLHRDIEYELSQESWNKPIFPVSRQLAVEDTKPFWSQVPVHVTD